MRVYKGIDIGKLFFAVCVVVIHVQNYITYVYPEPLEWLISLAVPFFFIASGYLMRESSQRAGSLSGYLFGKSRQTAVLFLIWIAIYFPLDIYSLIVSGKMNFRGIGALLYQIIVYGEGFYSWPMWYLYSLFIGLLMMACVSKVKHGFVWLFLFVVSVIYLPALFGHVFQGKEADFFHADNVLMPRCVSGAMFVLAGWAINRNRDRIIAVYGIILLISSIVLFRYELPFYRLSGGCGMFIIALQIRNISMQTQNLRKISTWLYYVHMYVIIILWQCFETTGYTSAEFMTCSIMVGLLLSVILTVASRKWPAMNKLIK